MTDDDSSHANPAKEAFLRAELGAKLLHEQGKAEAFRHEAVEAGQPALERLLPLARRDSGQCQVIRRFLLALYNPYDWSFALNELRGLDIDLQNDALAVLKLDMAGIQSIDEWTPNGETTFRSLVRLEQPPAPDEDLAPR